jgi:YVTN family beta-propeller protein
MSHRYRATIVTLSAACTFALSNAASGAPFAYVTNQGSHDVTVVDLATREAVATVPVMPAPAGVVAVSATGRVYVGHAEAKAISVIDMHSQRVVDTIEPGFGPMGLDASRDGRRLVGSDWAGNRVVVIDTADPRRDVVAIPVGRYPAGVAVHPDGRTAFVAERDDDHVVVVDLDAARVRTRVRVGHHPFAVTFDAVRERLYVLNVYSDDISVVDTRTLRPIARVAVGKAPYGAALTADGSMLYVTNQRDDSVSVVDAHTLQVVRTLDGFGYPEGVAAHGDEVVVVNWMDDSLSVLDAATGRLLKTVRTGQNSRGFGAFIGAPAGR